MGSGIAEVCARGGLDVVVREIDDAAAIDGASTLQVLGRIILPLSKPALASVAVFEPTHGSAPKYAELNPPIVNPIAMILSACMMLDHIGDTERADRIRVAFEGALHEGPVPTRARAAAPKAGSTRASSASSP